MSANDFVVGFSHPEYCLPCLYGCYRRSAHIPPSARNSQAWIYASHEGFLVHLSSCAYVCAKILASTRLGAVFQFDQLCNWDIYQYHDQEEEDSRHHEEEEGEWL